MKTKRRNPLVPLLVVVVAVIASASALAMRDVPPPTSHIEKVITREAPAPAK